MADRDPEPLGGKDKTVEVAPDVPQQSLLYAAGRTRSDAGNIAELLSEEYRSKAKVVYFSVIAVPQSEQKKNLAIRNKIGTLMRSVQP
jgi:hypothetical protein